MPRLTNNSLAGLSATSDMPLTIASSVVNTTSPLVMSSVAALSASVTATTQSGVSSFVALAPDVTGPSLIGSSPRPNTVLLPSTVGTVVASSYAISPSVVPFPYVPSQPWPTASFAQRPPFPSPSIFGTNSKREYVFDHIGTAAILWMWDHRRYIPSVNRRQMPSLSRRSFPSLSSHSITVPLQSSPTRRGSMFRAKCLLPRLASQWRPNLQVCRQPQVC